MQKKKIVIAVIILAAAAVLAGPVYRYITEVYLPVITPKSAAGKPAPEEYFIDMDGNELCLSDFLDGSKPVVMNFWAVDCPPCVHELPTFNKLIPDYSDKVTFLMVNCVDGSRDTVESATAYYEEMGFTFPLYFDITYSAADGYNVAEYPETVFIKADGTIKGTFSGSIPENVLKSNVQELLK